MRCGKSRSSVEDIHMKEKISMPDRVKWFTVLTTHLPMVFYILDKDGIFIMSEGLGLKKLGLVPGQVVGLSAFDVYRDFPDIIGAIQHALAGEYTVTDHCVGAFHIESHNVPQYNDENEVIGLIGAAIDIDERVRMEQSLRREKELTGAIMDSVPGILYLYDEEGHLVHWNKNHEEMSGYSAEELSRMTLSDWFDDSELNMILEEVQIALQGKTTSSDAHLVVKSGEKIPMHFTAVGLQIEGKSYITGIGIDLSELKKTQEELEETNRNLESKVAERTRELTEANRTLSETYEKMMAMQGYLIQQEKMAALGNLVAGVAHEINTPIGVGITAASHLMDMARELAGLMKRKEADSNALAAYLEDFEQAAGIIMRNLNRAGKLVKSFKQVSSDQSGEQRRLFDVQAYFEEILTSLSPMLKKSKVKVSVHCEKNLEMDGYPGSFAQIITNLISNSVTHAYEDHQPGLIDIRISKEAEMIRVLYRDDGKGISKEDLPRIFDPFFTTNRGAGGTGLGLSIVFNLVSQQFGGTIQCESAPGAGTTFDIHLLSGGS